MANRISATMGNCGNGDNGETAAAARRTERDDPFRADNVINGDLPLTRAAANVVSLRSVGSTNTVAEQYITSGRWDRDGMTVIRAREQTAGRGRLDHTWFSAPGKSFIMSFVSAVGKTVACDPRINGWLQMVAGLSVLDALRETLSETDMMLVRDPANIDDARDDVMLKWPNDIVYHGHKLGGILAQIVTVPAPDVVAVVYGIGLNIDVPFDELPTDEATSWQLITQPEHAGERPGTEAVMDLIASRTVKHIEERLWNLGLNPEANAQHLRRRLVQESWTLGHPVEVHYMDGTTERGIAHGINADASLAMTTYDGEERIVRTADVGVLPNMPR